MHQTAVELVQAMNKGARGEEITKLLRKYKYKGGKKGKGGAGGKKRTAKDREAETEEKNAVKARGGDGVRASPPRRCDPHAWPAARRWWPRWRTRRRPTTTRPWSSRPET